MFVVIIMLLMCYYGYKENIEWLGFGDFFSDPATPNIEDERKKTVWDWLDLIVVPVVLALVAWWFNRTTQKTERKIARNRQQEEALQSYIDRMTNLLLEKELVGSNPGDMEREIARTLTLTVLRELDGDRKGIVVRFLCGSKLITERDDGTSAFGFGTCSGT